MPAKPRKIRPASVAVRIAAAVFGGYALAVGGAVCISHALPAPRSDAVMAGLLAAFAIYAGAILWAFAARSPARAVLGLALPALALAGLAWLIGPNPAP